MTSRTIAGALACLAVVWSGALAAAQSSDSDRPSAGLMTLEDYKAYFRPGAYRTWTPDWKIRGHAELLNRKFEENSDGDTVGRERWLTLELSQNILPSRSEAWIKTRHDSGLSLAVWNGLLSSWAIEVDGASYEDDSEVWLSDEDVLAIAPADERFGTADAYYDAAIAETDGACCLSDEEYAATIDGTNYATCSFVRDSDWDALCRYSNVASGSYFDVYYKRLDETVS